MASTDKTTDTSSDRTTEVRKSESPLGAYLGSVSKYDLLTPEQEQTLAAQIAERRIACWKAMLGYSPFAAAIADALETALASAGCEQTPHEAFQTLRETSRAYRDRETKVNRDAFHAAQTEVAEHMAALDLDGKYADQIGAELEAIDANRRGGVTLAITYPPRASRPFARYVHNVRAHNRALRYTKNKFVRANLRLVVTIARRFDHGLMPLQDLVQEGNLGLMKAVDRFDGHRGFRFSTYATWWIRHAINRALANKGRTVRLPAHVSADLQRLRRTIRELETQTGERPSVAKLVEATGLTATRIRKLRNLTLESTVSLDAPAGGDDGRGLLERIEDPSTPAMAELLEHEALSAHLGEALIDLNPIELDILRNRYGIAGGETASAEFEPMTLRQLGERHSLSRERIRQLQERALGKLRREFARRQIA